MAFETREQWLTEAAGLILDERVMPIVGTEYPRPPIRISVGFPKHSRGGKAIAQCFIREVSTDGVNEIFINPEVDDPTEVMGALVHEILHAVDNCQSGHRNFFARVARRVGLEGPLTATHAGDALAEYLDSISDLLGDYPHRKMEIDRHHKKGGARMLKLECMACGFVARTTAKWIDAMPNRGSNETCPCCNQPALCNV